MLRTITIQTRLGAAFGAILLLLCGMAVLGIASLASVNGALSLVINDRFPKVMRSTAALDGIKDVSIATRNIVLAATPAAAEAELVQLKARDAEVMADLAWVERNATTDKGRQIMAKLHELKAHCDADRARVLELVAAGKRDEASAWLSTGMAVNQAAYVAQVRELVGIGGKLMAKSGAEAEQAYGNARTLSVALGTAGLLLAAALAWLISRSITAPLRQAVGIAGAIADGRLDSRIEVTGKDEIAQLFQSLRTMNAGLCHIVGQVRGGADAIRTAAGEIASGTADLSSRTEEQAASLEETASSMEELTGAVRDSAEYARDANRIAGEALETARTGGREVGQVVETMAAIDASSRKIADITGMIDGIAFQTNILALNAAVEAARAGEQGRGFAVVASEVRNLAQRSATAAREIKALIEESVARVDEGRADADRAGRTIGAMVDRIAQVAALMAHIDEASQQQAAGIVQINTALAQMDQVTQQNAALVEEAAAASESMQEQTEALTGTVSLFVLDETVPRDRTPPASQPRRASAPAVRLGYA
ncbi:methyl-accepting chemotaxis protein [Massilia putida]|uniref:methyl-accepting chemotaxis protein n=1 Tax=Massilia putida TaxID=1141883 RepID=UPI00095207FF|nr:methyl-accepting chemotaxis protein [Massilia putida]